MGWEGADYYNEWDSLGGQSPAMNYINYILLIGCLVIFICALYFVLQECCQNNQRDDETETIIMMQPISHVPSYTELPYDREQSHNHRIVHEYNRQSQVPLSTGSQKTPQHYYAYDHKNLATYYMYPTPCNIVESRSPSGTASAPWTASATWTASALGTASAPGTAPAAGTASAPGTAPAAGTTSAAATARLVRRNYSDFRPPREDERPPPYAPNH